MYWYRGSLPLLNSITFSQCKSVLQLYRKKTKQLIAISLYSKAPRKFKAARRVLSTCSAGSPYDERGLEPTSTQVPLRALRVPDLLINSRSCDAYIALHGYGYSLSQSTPHLTCFPVYTHIPPRPTLPAITSAALLATFMAGHGRL